MIEFDPSSPWSYELKHGALHKAGNYDNALLAFEEMLSKIEQSPDPEIPREFYPRDHSKGSSFMSSGRTS